MLVLVAGLALMADPQDAYQVAPEIVSVEREIAGGAVADDQLAQVPADPPADARMRGENFDCRADLAKRRAGGVGCGLEEKVDDPFQVGERL